MKYSRQHDWRDVGVLQEGCRTGGMYEYDRTMQYRWDVSCMTGGMNEYDRRESVQEGCRTGGMYEYQGWAPHSFAFRTFRSFAFKKENDPFFSVLFSSFWRLMKRKRMLHSF